MQNPSTMMSRLPKKFKAAFALVGDLKEVKGSGYRWAIDVTGMRWSSFVMPRRLFWRKAPKYMMERICVFCGSSTGTRPAYSDAAVAVGRALAENGIGVVYGGGNVGLMGVLADAALAAGAEVIGVIPRALKEKEVAHLGLTALHVVGSMHERKALMADLSSAFIALPGGYGTFDEFCEALTWTQLGIQRKPCGLLNVEGYYDGLLAMFNHAVTEGFLKPAHRDLIVADTCAEPLLRRLSLHAVPRIGKWDSGSV